MIELSFSRGKISWKFTEKAFPVMEYIVCRGFIIRDAARELLEEWKKFEVRKKFLLKEEREFVEELKRDRKLREILRIGRDAFFELNQFCRDIPNKVLEALLRVDEEKPLTEEFSISLLVVWRFPQTPFFMPEVRDILDKMD